MKSQEIGPIRVMPGGVPASLDKIILEQDMYYCRKPSWGIEIRLGKSHDRSEWLRLRSTGGTPYVFPTEDEADFNMRLCYGEEHSGAARVVQIGN